MKLLWLFFFVAFRGSLSSAYLKHSKYCKPWTCVSEKIGLANGTPPREEFKQTLKSLLPVDWENVLDSALDACYETPKLRVYSNTCVGQALLHCTVEQLIYIMEGHDAVTNRLVTNNFCTRMRQYPIPLTNSTLCSFIIDFMQKKKCPKTYLSKDNSCTPLSSVAGFKYMFSQRRYEKIDTILSNKRPVLLMKNANENCCNISQFINSTILNDCGFTSIIKYFEYMSPKSRIPHYNTLQIQFAPTTISSYEVDPLKCCDMSGFMDQSFINDCKFGLAWRDQKRLVIRDGVDVSEPTPSPITIQPSKNLDLQVVPLSCTKEECIFKNLNIVSASGAVDLDAFSKLLDNFTRDHPEWTSAKARVITKCLSKPITEYEAECEINKVLACTFDVLSENCIDSNKSQADPCKHRNTSEQHYICQISSSKLRPKKRRQYCSVPMLVKGQQLLGCGLSNIASWVYNNRPVHITKEMIRKPKAVRSWFHYRPTCKETTASAKCLMNKMGVLTKYGFMDYFKMKSRINDLAKLHEWNDHKDVYTSALMTASTSAYSDHCTSQKKLMNILDAMLNTCPVSKRKTTIECNIIFDLLRPTTPHFTYNRLTPFIQKYIPYVPRPIPFHNSPYIPTSLNSNLNVNPHRILPFLDVRPLTYNYSLSHSMYKPKLQMPVARNRQFAHNTSSVLILLPVYQRMYTPMLPE